MQGFFMVFKRVINAQQNKGRLSYAVLGAGLGYCLPARAGQSCNQIGMLERHKKNLLTLL
ncbi:hypothetical protein C7N43_00460 [Sphingobacteriales bacterium UPWRP_1]|nr:hypothetical protein BVG80_15390 [Sphingobacteriales bacterium TSM_CSM]PSJ79131.1 hypothetical protein C7N43_00460 [Sphingobacteriales bacterium UPWRP_1]